MGQTEKVHPIRMRDGGIEYFVESSCPGCGSTIFRPRYGNDSESFSDLDLFSLHTCPANSPPAPVKYPVDLGKVTPETAGEFRRMVESRFGKALRRFNSSVKRPGLPIHFVGDWSPFLGHVRAFSKSDVHRPIDAENSLLKSVLPLLQGHFPDKSGTRHRKYYLSARGVYKAERSKNLMVIRWKWPARY